MKQITYAITEEGLVYSRVGREIAVPVLDFTGIGQGGVEKDTGKTFVAGDFHGPMNYELQKFPLHDGLQGVILRWTKKIHISEKNKHRKFWGLPPLKPVNDAELKRLYRKFKQPKCKGKFRGRYRFEIWRCTSPTNAVHAAQVGSFSSRRKAENICMRITVSSHIDHYVAEYDATDER